MAALSTESELLTLSQTAKDALFVNHLLNAMWLRLDDELVIFCDNKQTIRLVTEDSGGMRTRRRRRQMPALS